MSDTVALPGAAGDAVRRPSLDARPHPAIGIGFVGVLVAGLAYILYSLQGDIAEAGSPPLELGVFGLLALALLVALGFEFVNGFHDTANAVATVIYTHSLPAHAAVVWSGLWNFLGVLASAGGVAYSVLNLLPVELILQVGSAAGFAMIFALLIAAILWNLGTWAFGLPASSSHTLIGSIIGVGLANQMLAPTGTATSGVDWTQARGVFEALLLSPLVGFGCSALLLLALKLTVRVPALYRAPEGDSRPPFWIRGLLILTCTGVSFAHGSNDGQKGMGLIMLILIGAVPTAYALNRTMPNSATPHFVAMTEEARAVFNAHAAGETMPELSTARAKVAEAVQTREPHGAETFAALSVLAGDIAGQVQRHGGLRTIPAAQTPNVRNDMYLASDLLQVLQRQGNAGLAAAETATLRQYRELLEASTRYIPIWVKVGVAIALGLGTMVGWKRIVVTVGERIGKTHLTYAQGAAAELVAAATIGAADAFKLPVSTTHVLSSGVAGTMAANGSGLQWSMVRNIALAWVLTLPAAMLLAGALYALFRVLF
ncbi:inorganic phosphate transporter [Siccirubricoccus sp. KC 17139]|uniref:Phosphate transporter n=1 Tax=Siccirubricoccus soli TaxID=2899147 RepID=A0ABT1DB39_9PROT|nr:inorganic phosphate transporter [Siccirubricoccus soli]MCO6419153.1 inorganic phosphate transporter [Siccirubricoccus soli]MCP2685288.1 inorganic phosphate transporter [Siccirubricoccus soli]